MNLGYRDYPFALSIPIHSIGSAIAIRKDLGEKTGLVAISEELARFSPDIVDHVGSTHTPAVMPTKRALIQLQQGRIDGIVVSREIFYDKEELEIGGVSLELLDSGSMPTFTLHFTIFRSQRAPTNWSSWMRSLLPGFRMASKPYRGPGLCTRPETLQNDGTGT